METKFIIKGMSCSNCVFGIEKNLSKVEGIYKVSVSLMNETMVVSYDEKKINEEKIINEVKKLGYQASLYNKPQKETNHELLEFIISIVFLIPLMYFSMGHMYHFPLPNPKFNYILQLILTIFIIIINKKYFINGYKSLKNKSLNMDTLVSLSALSSFIFSLIEVMRYFNGFEISNHLFFESSAMILTIVSLGKWLEAKSKRRASSEIEKLNQMIPQKATILVDNELIEIDTKDLKIDDIVVFKTGDYVSIDGRIIKGNASIDKASITGESMPVEVASNDLVVSGSIITSGYIEVKADNVGNDTLFSRIIESISKASSSKVPVQKLADKVAGYFVIIVTILSIITFIVWLLISKEVYLAFNYAISVLVISCPCSLGLATPVIVIATIAKALNLSIIYKDAETIQRAEKINCVLLDKTATITVGKPQVVKAVYHTNREDVHNIVGAIEEKSNHPVALCMREFVGKSNYNLDNYEYLPGSGSIAIINGKKYYLGNEKLIKSVLNEDSNLFLNDDSNTVIYLADLKSLLATFLISDIVKSDSKEAILALKNHQIKTVMVTGDNYFVAKKISEEVGISDFHSEVLPEGKLDIVRAYQNKGYKVLMTGDGINDAPALKASDIGVSLGTGTDISMDSSDIVLVNGSLKGIINAILLSKKANYIIKVNLFWAFFYNVIAIPIAAGVFSFMGLRLTPSIASICMSLSSLFVVLNALRMFNYKSYFTNNSKKEVKNKMQTIYVDNMMCNNCKRHVEEALLKLDGVKEVNVNLKTKEVKINTSKPVDDSLIKEAINNAGYKVIEK